MTFLHNLLHKHYAADKDGIGVFAFCESRLPERLGGKVHVGFSPDFAGARYWPVPCVVYDEGSGDNLLSRMMAAGNAHHAMALLREACAQENSRA